MVCYDIKDNMFPLKYWVFAIKIKMNLKKGKNTSNYSHFDIFCCIRLQLSQKNKVTKNIFAKLYKYFLHFKNLFLWLMESIAYFDVGKGFLYIAYDIFSS